MPKSGQAPTSPNAMPGGLGAILQQPGAAPMGASPKSIASIMERARSMSDMQLSDVLAGKSLDVPQYVAMTEAMGRKSLRTAMQGAQAQQQKQPSVKDRLLAEEAQAQAPQGGIDHLPAPNMGSVDMASGGIVAFDEGGEVPRFSAGGNWFTDWRDSLYSPEEKRYENIKRGKPTDEPTDTLSEKQANAILSGKTPGPAEAPMPPADMQKEIDASKLRLFKQEMADKENAAAIKPGPTQAERDAFYEKSTAKKTGLPAVLAAEENNKSPAQQDYLAKLAGVGEKTRSGIAGLKNEAQSQMLFDAMSALLGSRNIAEAGGKAGQLFASRIGTMGKEGRALEKEANDYDLNLAKYREAVESGDKDRALKLREMLETSKYHQAMIGKPDAGIAMLSALKDPANMAIYEKMKAASNKPMDIVSKDTALKEWGDMLPSQKRMYNNDFNAFYGAVSNSTMGGGKPVKFLGFEK
jgi:hypothetical protein